MRCPSCDTQDPLGALQAQQAEETSTTIQKLRSKVQAGEGSELELERAEGVLSNLTGSLNYLQTEMKVALKGARRAFRQGFGEDSESEVCSLAMQFITLFASVVEAARLLGKAAAVCRRTFRVATSVYAYVYASAQCLSDVPMQVC